MATDWKKIKNRYISSALSLGEIAKEFEISKSSVEKKCWQENWVELREANCKKIESKLQEKTAEKISETEADIAALRSKTTANLWRAIFKASENMNIEDGQKMRQIVSSFKDMCEVTEINADTKEQESAHNALIEAIKAVANED